MKDIIVLKQIIFSIINFTFSRSSGPGGQNVNKLNTKVTARLPIEKLYTLSEPEKNRLRTKLQNRINEDDEIVVQVQEERSQFKNREIALHRMVSLVICALRIKKRRIATTPSKQVKEKRLEVKKRKGHLKKLRKKPTELY